MGLYRAGFDVTGVDLHPQPEYPFTFVQADALTFPLESYVFIWASPPCQRFSMYSRNIGTSHNFPDLIAPIRARLRQQAAPWVIENVIGAPLLNPTLLCGTMLGLPLLRHRIFETSFPITRLLHPCQHTGDEIPVYGNGTSLWHAAKRGKNVSIEEKRGAMGIDWMKRTQLSQAIPPAFAEFFASHITTRGA